MPKWFSVLALPTVLGLLHGDLSRIMRRRPLGLFAMQPAVDGSSTIITPSTTKWPDGFSSESHTLVLQRVADIPGFEALSASLQSKDAAAAQEAFVALIGAHDEAVLKNWVHAQQQQPAPNLDAMGTAKTGTKAQEMSPRDAAVAAVGTGLGDEAMTSGPNLLGNLRPKSSAPRQLTFPLGEAELHWMVAASAQFSLTTIKQKSRQERDNNSQDAATATATATAAAALACSLGQTSVKLLARIRALGVLPSETTYYHCLHALRRLGEVDKVGPVFCTLIDARARQRDLAHASAAAASSITSTRGASKESAVASANVTLSTAMPAPLRPSLWGLAIGCEANSENTEAALALLERSAVENGDNYQIPPDHYDHLFLR